MRSHEEPGACNRVSPGEETGWLLEDASTPGPVYWVGGARGGATIDPSEATRFARRVDAERVSRRLGPGSRWVAREYMPPEGD